MEHILSDEEHRSIYENTIAPKVFVNSAHQENPVAVILGGQPGSGKSSLRNQAEIELHGNGGYVVVDPDDLREYHPQKTSYDLVNDKTSAERTHPDASKWADEIKKQAIETRRNLILDRTSKDPDSTAALIETLKKEGYRVEFRAIATPEKISHQRIFSRYEHQKESQGTGRFVSKDFHDKAYAGLGKTIQRVEKLKALDAIEIYDSKGIRLYANTQKHGTWEAPQIASKVFDGERNRPLSLEEHKERLNGFHEISDLMSKRHASFEEHSEQDASRRQATQEYESAAFRELPKARATETFPNLIPAFQAFEDIRQKLSGTPLNEERQAKLSELAKNRIAHNIENGIYSFENNRKVLSTQIEQPTVPSPKAQPIEDKEAVFLHAKKSLDKHLTALVSDPRFKAHTNEELVKVAFFRGTHEKTATLRGTPVDFGTFDAKLSNRETLQRLPDIKGLDHQLPTRGRESNNRESDLSL